MKYPSPDSKPNSAQNAECDAQFYQVLAALIMIAEGFMAHEGDLRGVLRKPEVINNL